ncbi:hypothetical protein [Roseovarius confluentis]|jgi:hypothetical protein|uniref:hypothetical protein n=1 Tax=Roseovarius confluentis TaxID=1852027 RepID=UPI001FE4F3A8|nr:hypothetical protein [Roseovarius confluentis]
MMNPSERRGGAPVGILQDLDPVEASAVIYLRMWCDGPEAQSLVWNDFATALGPRAGRRELQNFEQLCSMCAKHGRRPLVRHHAQCRCLGGDEATFANIVAHAADGEREDAFLMAANLVRPDMAAVIVALAQEFGLTLRRMMGMSGYHPATLPTPIDHPDPTKLH